MTFVDFIVCFRKSKIFKRIGFYSVVLIPIFIILNIQSMAYHSDWIGVFITIIIHVFWIPILFPILLLFLLTMFIILTILAINSVKKLDKIDNNTNVAADIGYIFCLFYLIYCLIFYAIIVPTSVSSINKGIDYINENSKNFINTSNNIDNLCITSSRNALNCFAKNINGGIIDKNYRGNAILTFDRIYYFNSSSNQDEHLKKWMISTIDVYVSDRLKIIAPFYITGLYNDYFFTKDKKINLQKGWHY